MRRISIRGNEVMEALAISSYEMAVSYQTSKPMKIAIQELPRWNVGKRMRDSLPRLQTLSPWWISFSNSGAWLFTNITHTWTYLMFGVFWSRFGGKPTHIPAKLPIKSDHNTTSHLSSPNISAVADMLSSEIMVSQASQHQAASTTNDQVEKNKKMISPNRTHQLVYWWLEEERKESIHMILYIYM